MNMPWIKKCIDEYSNSCPEFTTFTKIMAQNELSGLSELKGRLKSIEWGYGACPACGATDDKGHHSNCWLNKAIED